MRRKDSNTIGALFSRHGVPRIRECIDIMDQEDLDEASVQYSSLPHFLTITYQLEGESSSAQIVTNESSAKDLMESKYDISITREEVENLFKSAVVDQIVRVGYDHQKNRKTEDTNSPVTLFGYVVPGHYEKERVVWSNYESGLLPLLTITYQLEGESSSAQIVTNELAAENLIESEYGISITREEVENLFKSAVVDQIVRVRGYDHQKNAHRQPFKGIEGKVMEEGTKTIDDTVEDPNLPITLFGYVVPGYHEKERVLWTNYLTQRMTPSRGNWTNYLTQRMTPSRGNEGEIRPLRT